MTHDMIYILATFLGGYFLGSIPFGLVITKLAGLGDIRSIGSGNIGATNVLRTGRKGLAFLTLICDSGKGAFAVFIASMLLPAMTLAIIAAGIGGLLGHLYPVWLKFKGGKGVATTLGVLLALTPVAGVLSCLTWLCVAFLFRISSLSALIAVASAPIYAYMVYGPIYCGVTIFIALLVWYKHKDNIKRLFNGTEPRIGDK